MKTYEQFLESKRYVAEAAGFEVFAPVSKIKAAALVLASVAGHFFGY